MKNEEKNIIVKSEWYNQLIEDCEAIIAEAVFNSRWYLVEGYWQLGDRIIKENDNFQREKIYGKQIVQHLAKSLNKSERTLYYAIQFRKRYNRLDELPEGKNISWYKLCNKYLPTKVKKEAEELADKLPDGWLECPKCGYKFYRKK